MWRMLLLCLVLNLPACLPATPLQPLPDDCRAEASAAQLVRGHWLNGGQIWRLRQVALLEIGGRKQSLEGFLRLDPANAQARLLALNDMGMVLFDLVVNMETEFLQQAVPPLQQVEGLARGVGGSLRQIFLAPRPQEDDRLETLASRQFLHRSVTAGEVSFLFDCRGDLRVTRFHGDGGDWQVAYDDYRTFEGQRLPERLTLDDYRHRIKLSLWIKEVKRES